MNGTSKITPAPALNLPMRRRVGTATTPRDLVRVVAPDATDAECDFLLWERSCFPLGTVNEWFGQVRQAVAGVAS